MADASKGSVQLPPVQSQRPISKQIFLVQMNLDSCVCEQSVRLVATAGQFRKGVGNLGHGIVISV